MDYSLAHEISPDDSRQERWAAERAERGFDETELWNLDNTIAKFVLPRLVAFGEGMGGHPATLTVEGWAEMLNSMIKAFELLADDEAMPGLEQNKIMETGLANFCKYYRHLWN
jgi:hypothetical protein